LRVERNLYLKIKMNHDYTKKEKALSGMDRFQPNRTKDVV